MHRIAAFSIPAVALCFGTLQAQTSGSVKMTEPSASINTEATAPTQTQSSSPVAAPAETRINQIVYQPRLPSPAELTTAAAAQGLTVERIVQSANQVVAAYRNVSGQLFTVAYQTLPPSGAASGATVVLASPDPAVVHVAPPPAVYETAPRVIYYDAPDYYYYPRYYYPPVSFGFGFGYRSFHGGHSGHGR